MCIIWPQRLAVELNVISCITCPCFKSLVPGSGKEEKKGCTIGLLVIFFVVVIFLFFFPLPCLAVVQLPGLQASSE